MFVKCSDGLFYNGYQYVTDTAVLFFKDERPCVALRVARRCPLKSYTLRAKKLLGKLGLARHCSIGEFEDSSFIFAAPKGMELHNAVIAEIKLFKMLPPLIGGIESLGRGITYYEHDKKE